ncbi:MAG: hypothetical protein ACKOHK_07735, partial [Planctomycetia bacterium]
ALTGVEELRESPDRLRRVARRGGVDHAPRRAIALAAQASTVLRRLATAARLLALPAVAGRPAGVEPALREAGVAAWAKALALARESLGQLGPRRARMLPTTLLDLDLALKGDASRGLRARLALERLFCKMSRQAAPAAPTRK